METFYIFMLCLCVFAVEARKHVVCYVGTWAHYRPGNGKFKTELIDPNLCTHLMYGFFGIYLNGTIKIYDPYLDLEEDWGIGNIKRFNELKDVNPNLKTFAAIGGWNEGSKNFSYVSANPILRYSFIQNAVNFCKEYGFDGMDIDWEYPAQRDGDPFADRANFVIMLKELYSQ